MDRSPYRTRSVRVWVVTAVLLLPACSEQSPTLPLAARSPNASDGVDLQLRPLLAEPGLLAFPHDAVAPAGHLFAPPPLPSVEGPPSSNLLTRDSEVSRPPVVRMAPSPTWSPSGELNAAGGPRRLPDPDEKDDDVAEPQLLDAIPEPMPLVSDAPDEDLSWQLRRLPSIDASPADPPIAEEASEPKDNGPPDVPEVRWWQVVEPPADVLLDAGTAPGAAESHTWEQSEPAGEVEPIESDDVADEPTSRDAVPVGPGWGSQPSGADEATEHDGRWDTPGGDSPVHLLPPSTWDPVDLPHDVRQPIRGELEPARNRGEAMVVLTRQVEVMTRRAEDLAERGAYFAARAELIKALRVITQALDVERRDGQHTRALGQALRAFREAADFLPRGSQLEAELSVRQVVSGHRTPVLKDEQLDHVGPIAAQQRYLEYAQRQLVIAGGSLPVASRTMHSLAKVCEVLDRAKLETQTLYLPQAVALHQAALMVDPRNHRAANELAVLLARFGQLEDARRVLLHAISVHAEPVMWHNLSVVHERLGESDLAQRARREAEGMAAREQHGDQGSVESVRWVDAKTFSAAGAAAGY